MNLQNELEAMMHSINIDKIEPTLIESLYIAKDGFNKNFEKIGCKIFGIQIADLYSKSREQNVVWCRYFMFEYLLKNTLLKNKGVGEKYNRDHSTVVNGMRKHRELLDDRLYKIYHNQFMLNINQ